MGLLKSTPNPLPAGSLHALGSVFALHHSSPCHGSDLWLGGPLPCATLLPSPWHSVAVPPWSMADVLAALVRLLCSNQAEAPFHHSNCPVHSQARGLLDWFLHTKTSPANSLWI